MISEDVQYATRNLDQCIALTVEIGTFHYVNTVTIELRDIKERRINYMLNFFEMLGIMLSGVVAFLAFFGLVFMWLIIKLDKDGVYETKKYIWRREKKNV